MKISPNRFDREAKIKICSFVEAALRKKGEPELRIVMHLGVLEAMLRLSGGSIDVETIAGKSGCSRSSVHRSIKALEALGILTSERAGRRLRTITFVVPEQSVPTTPWAASLGWEG
jgi:DNA-binding MarR family transcriptional regulator